MTISPRTLDVRPTLLAGGDPLPDILQAFAELEEGQSLRLLAPFEPVPLFRMMEAKGYTWTSYARDGDDREVLFTPAGAAAPEPAAAAVPDRGAAVSDPAAADWPAPAHTLDNRGLPPPEPLVRTLEAVETLPAGDVLEIWIRPRPAAPLSRAHPARPPGAAAVKAEHGYRVLIRCGSAAEARP